MKYRLFNNYTTNFSELTMKLAVSAGIAGTLIVSGQPARAVNELSEDKITNISSIKTDLFKAIVGEEQQSFPEVQIWHLSNRKSEYLGPEA